MHIHIYTHMYADKNKLKQLLLSKISSPFSISRLLKMIGLFRRILSLLQGSFAKETYHFKEATNRSHPISETAACQHDLLAFLMCMFVCLCVCKNMYL